MAKAMVVLCPHRPDLPGHGDQDDNWIPSGWFNAIQTNTYCNLSTPVQAFDTQARGPALPPIERMTNPTVPEWRVGEVVPTE